jgi:hypothetical protein
LRQDSQKPEYLIGEFIDGIDRRPVTWTARVRRRIENLPPSAGYLLIVGVAVGLYAGAYGGILIALAGHASMLNLLLGIPLMGLCAVIAAHLTPPRILELRE